MKLTKAEATKHAIAQQLLHGPKPLGQDDVDYVLRHWQPGAEHNLTVAGAHFTPVEIADAVAMYSKCEGGRYLDLCAGIGALSWGILGLDPKARIVAVELNPDFVEIGKRLMPGVQWIRGDAFDEALMRSLGRFDVGVSNPPFGQVNTYSGEGPAHLAVATMLLRTCRLGGTIILPHRDTSCEDTNEEPSRAYRAWAQRFPVAGITPHAIDLQCYPKFRGVDPNVAIADLWFNVSETGNPYLW